MASPPLVAEIFSEDSADQEGCHDWERMAGMQSLGYATPPESVLFLQEIWQPGGNRCYQVDARIIPICHYGEFGKERSFV
jgi:hypothetical protein